MPILAANSQRFGHTQTSGTTPPEVAQRLFAKSDGCIFQGDIQPFIFHRLSSGICWKRIKLESNSDCSTIRALADKLPPEFRSKITLAERFIEQGREECLSKGLLVGEINACRNILGFPPWLATNGCGNHLKL